MLRELRGQPLELGPFETREQRHLAERVDPDRHGRRCYAARDQRTSASAIRLQDRCRLRSSARGVAASRFAGMAARRAAPPAPRAGRRSSSLEEASVPANGRPVVLLRLIVCKEQRELECFRQADELELGSCRQRLGDVAAVEARRKRM